MRAGRLRSRAIIRRPTEDRQPLGDVETTYPAVGMAWVEVRPPRRLLANYGAGEIPEGRMEAELREHIDVRMRDVLEIIAGPESGKPAIFSPALAHPAIPLDRIYTLPCNAMTATAWCPSHSVLCSAKAYSSRKPVNG